MIHNKHSVVAACTVALAFGAGCGGEPDNAEVEQPQVGSLVPADDGMGGGADGTTDNTPSGGTPTGDGPVAVVVPAGVGMVDGPVIGGGGIDDQPPEEEMECASTSEGTQLVGVTLAFAFDVSASMGSYFESYYSRELKWEPVVAATKAFFADTASEGVSATLTFFPNDSAGMQTGGGGGGFGGGGFGGGAMCDSAGYATPDVALTALPSTAFADAIDAVTPATDDDWRVGTPTGPALEGTIDAIRDMQAAEPNSKYVIVLVSDGAPALCSAQQDDINNVASIAAAVADEIPTYVIGVANPATDEDPDPPDDVANLHLIAEAGGTDQAFVINTNDAAQTASDFRAVIEAIRENSFGCALEIPAAPAGKSFDSEKVNVNYSNEVGVTELTYDPSCSADFSWHYDNEENPTVIQMCEALCEAIKADASSQGSLNVEFGCVRRVPTAL